MEKTSLVAGLMLNRLVTDVTGSGPSSNSMSTSMTKSSGWMAYTAWSSGRSASVLAEPSGSASSRLIKYVPTAVLPSGSVTLYAPDTSTPPASVTSTVVILTLPLGSVTLYMPVPTPASSMTSSAPVMVGVSPRMLMLLAVSVPNA